MKHFTKLFVGILFLILGGTQSGMAQTIDDMLLKVAVDPATVARSGEYVYLYNVTNKKFVHGGGEFGAQAVLSDRGIRFEVTKTRDGKYRLESAIYNTSHGGGYLGVDIYNRGDAAGITFKTYIDRGTVDSDISFTSVAGRNNIYQLSFSGDGNRPYWYTHYEGGDGVGYVHVVDTRLRPDEWCLIKRDDYNTILAAVAQQGRYNITGLIGNSRFLRNVSDADHRFWKVKGLDYDNDDYCTTIDPHLGAIQQDEDGFQNSDDYARAYGAFGCLEIGAVNASEESPVEFFQEITGLKPGLYMVEAQAFFDKNDYSTYKEGKYDIPNTTDASNAYLFANGAETLIPVLNDGDQTTFDGYVSDFKEALDYTYQEWVGGPLEHYEERHGTNNMYFRRNVAAAYFLAKGNAYEPDESFHRVRVYVNVTDDGSGTGTLKLGVNKKGKGGRVYVDNFGLYYVGYNAIGLDAYQRVESEVDQNTYLQQYPFHLSRKFVLDAWNAITLPCDVTGSQIMETFGDDAKLCKLEGVNPQNKDQILFSTVNLFDNYDTPAIVRGGCYLIWVTKGPVVAENTPHTFTVKKENDPDVPSQEVTFPYGNIYTITGVSCPEGMVTPDDNTVTTTDGKLSYTYFYHRPGAAQGATPVPKGSYVMSDGKMYHLTGAWGGLLGTCWYITDLTTSSNSKVMAIEGEGGTTDINGIVTEVPGDKAMEGVYNINGQKVADGTSLEGLPKGIYIVNGKKHVVK